MPAPTTTDQLLDRLRVSRLVPPADLDAFVAALDPDEAAAPRAVLDRLVAGGLLTPFQADRLAAGKYKGFVLGRYVILDKLGGGGMGQVFLAEHQDMRRAVAVKVLPAFAAADPVARERFFREARAVAALDHPNIVRVFDFQRDGSVHYIIMEYVDGVNLQRLVARAGPLPVAAAADYGRQIALGLQHAHAAGLVHRDVKPANLLLGRDGGVRVLDLGLVRWEAETESKLTNKVDQTILGTADYLAPEQAINSAAVDGRADVYSLGATLYFLLAGRTLFPDGKTAQKLISQQLKEPTPIRQLRPDVPDGLAAVVHKALAKAPAGRFQTPQEMADALAAFARGPVPAPDPAVFPPPPPRRVVGVAPRPAGVAAGGSAVSIALGPVPLQPPGESHLLQDLASAFPRRPDQAPTLAASADPTPPSLPSPPRPAAADEVVLEPLTPASAHPGRPLWRKALLGVGLILVGAISALLTLWGLGLLKG